MATAALQSQQIITDLNVQINLLITVRDRISFLGTPVLPNSQSVWDVIDQATKDALKTTMGAQITLAQSNLTNVIQEVSSM